MGNQQTGGDVDVMVPEEGRPLPPWPPSPRHRGGARNLALVTDIPSSKLNIPTTVITPPEDEDRTVNGYGVNWKDQLFDTPQPRSNRRGSIAIGEITSNRLQQAHMPKSRSLNPASSRINNLLGVPMPSRARRGSIDTNPEKLLAPRRKSEENPDIHDRSPSPSKKGGSRSNLLDKLLSISSKGISGKSSEKLDKLDKKDDSDAISSPFLKPRRGRRASDFGVFSTIQATLQASNSSSKKQLEPLDEGSGR